MTGFGLAVIQATCWNPQHKPSPAAEKPCLWRKLPQMLHWRAGSQTLPSTRRSLLQRSESPARKGKSLQHRNCLMMSVCGWELESEASCPQKHLAILPCWMLKECQRQFLHESCVNVENVSSLAARGCNEAGKLLQLPFCRQDDSMRKGGCFSFPSVDKTIQWGRGDASASLL